MLVYDGDAPDPFLLRTPDGFLCFATGSAGLDLQVLSAPAPTGPWTLLGDPLARLPPWAVRGRTWSPAVLTTGDGFVLYAAVHERASGRQVLATFVAASPAGPYEPVGGPLVRQVGRGGAIDPDPFVDRGGTATLLWKSDERAVGRPSSLWARTLRPDGLGFASRWTRPTRLLRQDADWEAPTIEAPCVVRGDDGYLLLYSAGAYEDGSYGIGWARAGALTGPWTKGGRLLGSGPGLAGPGGQSVLAGSGVTWLAYHGWAPDRVGYLAGGRRGLYVDRLEVGPDGPRCAP